MKTELLVGDLMTIEQVVIGPETPHLRVGGEDHWFCSSACRDRFAA